MTEALLLNILLIAAGLYFGIRNARMLTNDEALRSYITTSPKTKDWVSKYGVEESMKLARRTSVRLGLIIGIAMLGFGAWNLWSIYGQS